MHKALLGIILIATLGGLTQDVAISLAAKKKPLIEQMECRCSCQYRTSDGKWHWGQDFDFRSSSCSILSGKSADCYSSEDDGLHDGNWAACGMRDSVSSGPKLKQPKLNVDPSKIN